MAPARKKNTGRILFLAILGSFVLTALIVGGSLWWLFGSKGVTRGSVLEITLNGGLAEGPPTDVWAQLATSQPPSLFGIRRALRHAATDDRVAGVLVEVGVPAMGLASLEELTSELTRFRDSGKPVHVLLQTDTIGEPHVYLAAGATRAWATPAAFWMLDGYHADIPFWRGTLEKLHIEPDFILFKEYKSAGEPFSRHEMSEHMREAMTDVIGDLQGLWFDQVAARRGIDRAALKRLVDQGMCTAGEAVELGLVDELGYLDQVEEALREAAETEEYTSIALAAYLKDIDDDPDGKHIAVVFGEGQIVASRGSDSPFGGGGMLHGPVVAEHLRKAAEDEDVAAIVFRVNSPGGSAVGSDLVWREIARARADGKPVVVSMSDVAGSGGYWVSMGADAIVAHPATITGSIGVVFGKFNLRGFYEWIGANVESLSFAENSDIMGPFSTMSETQRARTVGVIDSLYTEFKRKVADGRGLDFDDVEVIARGRIWSGGDARDRGLVDELGGLDAAVALAAQMAELPADVGLKAYPEARDPWELIMSGELEVGSGLPDLVAVEAWITGLATPRVLAITPDLRIR